jgi:hypothetical protein
MVIVAFNVDVSISSICNFKTQNYALRFSIYGEYFSF